MVRSTSEEAAAAFSSEFTRWRQARGYSKKMLAQVMGFDPSYLSHIEARRHRPTEDFARRAERALDADGALWRIFEEYAGARSPDGAVRSGFGGQEGMSPSSADGLRIKDEVATLRFDAGVFHYSVRRVLFNVGAEPVTRFPVRILTDRFPNDPARSNAYHNDHPMTWDELGLEAFWGEGTMREPMAVQPISHRVADKEAWLLFSNELGHKFPLYRGQRATIEFTCTVGDDKWGPWFEREIRLPTEQLTIVLQLPTRLGPRVSGVYSTFSTNNAPLPTPIKRTDEGDFSTFKWSTDRPALNAQYRLEWRYDVTAGGLAA